MKFLPPPSPVDPNRAATINSKLVFGRKPVAPVIQTSIDPICADQCRMIAFGRCEAACRLMSRADKEEPSWTNPTT